jgi:nucleotide-binding universal stress UspA family protein
MYETILAPLDGSKRAERILPHVEGLAHQFGSRVVFLQVVESVFIYPGPHGTHGSVDLGILQLEELEEEAKAYLASLEGEFRAKGIEAKTLISGGPVVPTIIDVAEREGADLIAMASHGRTGLARVFYGSVAAGVLQQVDRPLLIIRAAGE